MTAVQPIPCGFKSCMLRPAEGIAEGNLSSFNTEPHPPEPAWFFSMGGLHGAVQHQ
jgi:hypothetical protein